MAAEEQLRRQEPDRKVEEAGLREGMWPIHSFLSDSWSLTFSRQALLPPMHPDQGDQLQQYLHLSRAPKAAQGRPSHSMRKLWMQRLWKQ